MIITLLDDKTQQSVINTFNLIEDSIGVEKFKQVFPIILTDNGSEFLDPESLEKSSDGLQKRSSLYYCDPNCSFQKGGIEKNHEYIRYVLPKGNSFNTLTQKDVELLMNHINSTSRDYLNGRSPAYLWQLLMDVKLTELLNIISIPPDNVNLTPKLLSKKNIT